MSLAKKRRVERTNDPDVLLKWLEEVSSGQEEYANPEDPDEFEEDILTQSDHNSASK